MGTARRIAVVGAGLGGLATAIALRQQGFEVDVYEQAAELGAFGAGINISANAVKVFTALGLRDRLHEVSFEPRALIWRNWHTDRIARRVPLERSRERFGATYYIMHRGDLHRVMQEALPAESIHLDKRCTGVELRAEGVGIRFADGTSAEADVVIGADGIHSAIRRHVFGGVGARYAGTMCWRTLIPMEGLPPDAHNDCVNTWSGAGFERFVISYFVRQGRFINVLCVMRQPEWTSDSWSLPSSREEMLRSFGDTGPSLARVLGAADQVFKWGQFTGEPAADWVRGRLALLGDSAHAMLATWGQGACMAFEDAYVLARWLGAHRDDPELALRGYESVRKPRATQVQAMSRVDVRFKKQTTAFDKLRREWAYVQGFGKTTPQLYRWLFGYDPVAGWRG